MYDRSEDAPIGSPENYSANLEHPFNQIVSSLVAGGGRVLCGGELWGGLPKRSGGIGDVGPGGNGWDYNMGYGVINAAAAVKALGLKPKTSNKRLLS